MTSMETVLADDDVDNGVDVEIAQCLDIAAPRSFFLFAGAGSGKTRSLVNVLRHLQKSAGESLRLKGQHIGVITYTNAASDEIKRRLSYDPLIDVSTIHSFAWSLIEGLNQDIREWLRVDLAEDIDKLQKEEVKGRKGTKASTTRLGKIVSKTKRLQNLNSIKTFVYSPSGANLGRDALNHSEVIQLTSHFLSTKAAMQSILVGRYPFLLVDESQDTNKHLIDALFAVQAAQKEVFALGLLGDMMQRIYSDGKEGLGQKLPADWASPGKKLNHRCPRRVVTLINKVRSATDKQLQQPRSDSLEGYVRLFIIPTSTADKPGAERAIALHMQAVTGDAEWAIPDSCKTLTLEHRMAARRLGFLDMFVPLYDVESWRPSFLDGSLPAIRFFSEGVLPLVRAQQRGDRFTVGRIARNLCPLLTAEALRAADDTQAQLKRVSRAIDELTALWKDGADPALSVVLRSVASSNLLVVPESLRAHAYRDASQEVDGPEDPNETDRQTERAAAIDAFLTAPASQIEPFAAYVSGRARFDTHQGVKGLEFDRVMVIMDDEEARGFTFKYENLFGGKGAGEPSVENTRRLFYVVCSRAMKSLALVAYTDAAERVRQFVLSEGWFMAEEVVMGVPG